MNMLIFLSLKSLILIKGVTSIEVSENEKSYSWEEIENSDYFAKLWSKVRMIIKMEKPRI
jgi:hypothetical protein